MTLFELVASDGLHGLTAAFRLLFPVAASQSTRPFEAGGDWTKRR
jgi:hypothetical protein